MENGKNQYSNTPIKDFYLDLAVLPTAQELATGQVLQEHIVTPRQQHRPDLLSYDLYGNSSYWWTIAILNQNQLRDPIRDLRAGVPLRVISPDYIAGVV